MLLVELTVSHVKMLQLVLLAKIHTQKQLTTNVFALLNILLMQVIPANLATLDVKSVQDLPIIVKVVSILLFFKEINVKLVVIMVSLILEMFVKDVLQDVLSVLKILSATIVLITSTCIKENVTLSVLLEPLEIDQAETGSVLLATLPAKLA